ncbi:hypothetical protein VC83_09508 [Pseudogymnoascus destructans]|uniref:Uncharacterized protein n=1 Tax=Pseudogymnoascus destructans TaxID=655981 RepID=A0A176ZY93_9PEZI|nr:uncharacterized protein VC83_09508 [Pseudogymnoascus destructans]OAF54202.1 hypothetical protein VC83_09508 [Pseudogymnoascus destructans]
MEGFNTEEVDDYDQSPTYAGLVKLLAKPGLDEQAKNVALHGSINRPLEGVERPTLMGLVQMRDSLDYRMSQVMGAATAYKSFWELDMPDCEEVDINAYSGPNVPRSFDLVCEYALFDEPATLQGHSYAKGLKYIACCIAEAGWNQAEATAKLDSLVKYKEAVVRASGIPKVYGMSRLLSTINTKIFKYEWEIRQELKTISQRTKRRIRAMSPGKSDTPRQKGLPGEWIEDTATADMARLGLCGAGPSSPGPSYSGPSSPSSSRGGAEPSSQ